MAVKRVLLSAVGTRGDVQPIVALALRVRELGTAVRMCVPPNFVEWVRGLGFEAAPVGVEMRQRVGGKVDAVPDLIADQFESVGAAAEGCDGILGANAHQYAARSIAELRSLPYVTALYAPVALPTPDHAPPPSPGSTWEPGGEAAANLQRWADNARAWNARALERVNANRARLGLAPIDDVLRFNITDHPWLAADAALAPVPATPGMTVFETGAWVLEDTLGREGRTEAFLDAGAPPVYVGFGSMPVRDGVQRVRALPRSSRRCSATSFTGRAASPR